MTRIYEDIDREHDREMRRKYGHIKRGSIWQGNIELATHVAEDAIVLILHGTCETKRYGHRIVMLTNGGVVSCDPWLFMNAMRRIS